MVALPLPEPLDALFDMDRDGRCCMIIELVYITIHYKCGCVKARPVRPPRINREIYSSFHCETCTEKAQREAERLVNRKREEAIRYMVDGTPMFIFQGRDGNWRAKRSANGQRMKFFGRQDPRPMLEEALE
jgi:hypothetical protein